MNPATVVRPTTSLSNISFPPNTSAGQTVGQMAQIIPPVMIKPPTATFPVWGQQWEDRPANQCQFSATAIQHSLTHSKPSSAATPGMASFRPSVEGGTALGWNSTSFQSFDETVAAKKRKIWEEALTSKPASMAGSSTQQATQNSTSTNDELMDQFQALASQLSKRDLETKQKMLDLNGELAAQKASLMQANSMLKVRNDELETERAARRSANAELEMNKASTLSMQTELTRLRTLVDQRTKDYNAKVNELNKKEGEWKTKVASLQAELSSYKRKLECSICMDAESNHAFLPCGHLACGTCARAQFAKYWANHTRSSSRNAQCPKCRADIQMVPNKIYFN